ncbi:hypothetical protein C5167_040615 [Papaver somniferum]|uniref:PGG domain-containing protein n=1 Tax=Papaver somniferum TaxID=3469 RepID=A0A4Y7IFK3_PAPSO|nr:hypothetical protein C5167_040615 [Papaver somniferum]
MDCFRSMFGFPEKTTIDSTEPHSKLYEAIELSGDIDSLKQLLALTAPKLDEVDVDNHLLRQTHFNNNSLHIAVQLSKSVTLVEEILNQCGSSKSLVMLMQQNMNGDTPLHVAARLRSKEIISVFIDHASRDSEATGNQREDEDVERGIPSKGLQLVRIANNKNNTALHEALQYQTLSGIPQLLTNADPSFEYFANDLGETPLYLAVEHGTLDLVEDLLEICPSQSYGAPAGRTALHALALQRYSFQGEVRHVTYYNFSSDKISKFRWSHYIPLTLTADAVMEVDPSICYMSDKDGMTALHHAAADETFYRSTVKIMKTMLGHCPDCWEVLDNEGRNFLHVAAHNNNSHVLKYVLNEISSDLMVDTMLGMKDKKGQIPYDIGETFFRIIVSNPRLSLQWRNWYGLSLNSYETYLNKQSVRDRKAAEKTEAQEAAEDKEKERMRREQMEYYNQTLVVVSALIATVAFASNFTLPGGYNSDGKHKGMAVLAKKPSFIVFIVSNSLAMVLSALAILIQFVGKMISMEPDNPAYSIEYQLILNAYRSENLLYVTIFCNLLAILAMMVAFVTGSYTVTDHLPGLAIPVCIVGCFFFVLFFFVIHKILKWLKANDDKDSS